MSYLIVFAVFLLASLLQSSSLPTPSISQAQPNLILILVVGWGLARGATEGVVWALLGGVLLGLTSSVPLGAVALALLPVALLTQLGQLRLVHDERLLALGIGFLGTFLYGAVLVIVLQTSGYAISWGQSYRYLFLPGALLNALLVTLIYPVFPWLRAALFPVRS